MAAPLVPHDVDLRDFPFMPLDVVRLRDSDLAALATAEQFRCAVLLWCASWHQIPAASLPIDNTVLAQLCGLGRDKRKWLAQKEVALRGWIECDDGRLYHPVVAEKALEAWARRGKAKIRGKAGASSRWGNKHSSSNGPSNATSMDQAMPDLSTEHAPSNAQAMLKNGNGQGQRESKKESSSSLDSDSGQKPSPHRERLDQLEAKCREAADLVNDPWPTLMIMQPITALLDAGYDLDTDVLPILRKFAKAGRKAKSWAYYVEAIKESRDKARAAANGSGGPRASAEPDEARWRRMFDWWKKSGDWPIVWGPGPDIYGCEIPKELIEQWSAET